MKRTIDLHSHIAWEIDDGMPSKEDALIALNQAKEDGMEAICSTPHIIPGQIDSSFFQSIRARQEELKAISPLSIYFGGEVMINSEFIDYIDEGLYPTMNGTKYLLVEFNVLKDIHQIPWHQESLYECVVRGYRPVIAHIERYFKDGLDWDLIQEWQENGYVLQINRTSLLGLSGSNAQKNAWKLLEKGVGHLVCTDTHRASGSRIECLSDVYNQLINKIGEENAHLLCYKNPQSILMGDEVKDLEIRKRKFFQFFRR